MTGRRLRDASVVLGLVLMVALGAIVVVWVSQAGGPITPGTPTGTATSTSAAFSPGSPSSPISPSARTSGATGNSSPGTPSSPDGSATAPGSAGGHTPATTGSASPGTGGGAPQREITFVDLGIDTAANPDEPPQPRFFTFVADGPGRIEATLDEVTFGEVRLCVWQGEAGGEADQDCQTLAGGTLGRDATAAGPSTWTVSVIGSQAGASPSARLTLRWPTNDARLHVGGFRFQGEAIENYNGFALEVDAAADGGLVVAAAFDDDLGGRYPWRLQVSAGDGAAFVDEGDGSSMSSGTTALSGRRYRVALSSRQPVAEQRVLLSADLDWP